MTFTPDQIEQLSAPLAKSAVKERVQSGQKLSYIEGWHAIAEANRIFGFGEWSRETIELRQLGEPYVIEGKTRVNYSARVRITVGTLVRDGCGFGQGIDRDPGKAHESALKEAETDAMKRALMTFGNPFGLALYDRKQENVFDDKAAPAEDEPPAKAPPQQLARKDSRALFSKLQDMARRAPNRAELKALYRAHSDDIAKNAFRTDILAMFAEEAEKFPETEQKEAA